MKSFFEKYVGLEKLAPLVREIGWMPRPGHSRVKKWTEKGTDFCSKNKSVPLSCAPQFPFYLCMYPVL